MDMGAAEARELRIAILGGSFNPVHNGHVAICRYVAERDRAGQILVVPCFEHPFGKPMAPFAHRFAMCDLALAPLPRVQVSTLESDLGGVSYTARTVRAVQAQHPAAHLALIIGSDIDLTRWRDAAWLRAHVEIITIPRGPDSQIPDVSASAIRACIAAHQPIADSVPPAVAAYIVAQRLYQ